jgi:hypothetical protein
VRIPIGAIIVSIFAIVWTAAGARDFNRRWFWFLLALAILISTGLICASSRIEPAHPVSFNGEAYGIAVTLEAILIVLAVVTLRATNRKFMLLPIISIIVGLHFFGMVPALGSNLYWWIGGTMSLLPILAMSMLPQKKWDPTVGLGSALILWLAVVCAFFW